LIASPARAAYGGRAAAGPASWRGRPGHGGRNQNGAGQVASPRSRAARRTRHAGSGDRLAPGRRRPARITGWTRPGQVPGSGNCVTQGVESMLERVEADLAAGVWLTVDDLGSQVVGRAVGVQ